MNVAQFFQSGLEATAKQGSEGLLCDLVDTDDDSLYLEFALSFDTEAVICSHVVQVLLKPAVEDPVHTTDTKIRDLEDRLQAMESKCEKERAAKAKVPILLLELAESNSIVEIGGVLKWKRCDYDMHSKHFAICENGSVQIKTSGCYVVTLIVRHSKQKNADRYFDIKQGTSQLCQTTKSSSSSALSRNVKLDKDATLTVVCTTVARIFAGTTLTITPAH